MPKAKKVKQVEPTFDRENIRALIWGLRNAGLSWKEVAQNVGKTRRAVRFIYQTVRKNASFKEKSRSGRPKKLSDRDRRKVIEILRKAKVKTAEAVRKEAAIAHEINVSVSTIRRAFKECGYVARVKRKKPLLTAEEKRKRLQWANEHKTWTVDKWKNVIWADETAFTLIWEGREYAWTKKDAPDILVDEAVTPTKKFGGGKLMVWGCIIYEGTGFFCKIDDTLDSPLYCKILRKELMDTIEYYDLDASTVIYQHDNDPKHTSEVAQETLDDLGIDTMKFPTYSPDLNPIENYWAYLKTKLRDKKQIYSTLGELWEAVQDEVAILNEKLCQNIIASMPERVQAVIKAKGGYTKY